MFLYYLAKFEINHKVLKTVYF